MGEALRMPYRQRARVRWSDSNTWGEAGRGPGRSLHSMLKSKGAQAGGPSAKVYKCVFTPNREDRSRFVALVGYEATWSSGLTLVLRPVRRVYQWVTDPEGTERFMCVRVTRLRWKDLQPGQAHVEMRDAWLAHVKEQKALAKQAKETSHVQEGQIGGGV